MKDIIHVNAVNGSILAVVTLSNLDMLLKISATSLAIAYTIWKWRRDYKKGKRK